MRMELMKGDSLEDSVHTPIYNPHILPLTLNKKSKLAEIRQKGGNYFN